MEKASPVVVTTDSMVATIRSAARRLTGYARRQFQAEVTLQYCDGSARKAERIFGWGRSAVITGLCEKRTGLRCVDAFQLRGRKKSKVAVPQLGSEICGIEESPVHSARTSPAVAVGIENSAAQIEAQLKGIAPAPTDDSAPKFDGLILNRVGKRLRRALKTRRRES